MDARPHDVIDARPRDRAYGTHHAATILLVFALHNAWNCWAFLNFTNFPPAMELLGVDAPQIGLLTTAGFVGILVALPLATLCQWQRVLLFCGGAHPSS